MLLTLSLVLLLIHFVTKKGGGNLVPNAWQSLVELIYDFVLNLVNEQIGGRSREIEGVVRRVGWRGLARGSKSRSPSKDRASRRIWCLSIWKQRTISIIRHFVFIVPLARRK
jgi:hypothetical protein